MIENDMDKYNFVKEIIKSSKDLENTISNKGTKILRGIEEDSNCKNQLEKLKRLIDTLEKYSNKSHSLRYIGFLGHYSSGKSSTQNSLLNIWKTNKERKTDLNPTDTSITFTTHKDNSERLIGNNSQENLVIVTEYTDLDLLKDKVIIDTPGSGEPEQNEKMVRDFLPICDLLVYVFSATNPLDKSDIPVLQKAYEKLPFIPIKFIITRSDEFSIDKGKPLTPDNLDTTKINDFTSILISRLKQIIPSKIFTKNDFLFIDNKLGFNTDKLNDFIFDSDEKLDLHLYKIKYFLNRIKSIRDYFKNYAGEQRDFLNKLVNTATNNHEKYKEQFSMGKSTLTESWRNIHNSIISSKKKLEKKNSSIIKNIKIRNKIENIKPAKEFNRNILYKMEKGIDTELRSCIESIDAYITSVVTSLKQQTRSIVNSEELEKIDIALIDNMEDSYFKYNNNISPLEIIPLIKNIHSDIVLYLYGHNNKLNDEISSILRSTKNNSYLNSEERFHNITKNELMVLLETFYTYVELYQSAIMSRGGRNLSERLKFGKEIDEIEREEVEEKYKINIENSLFVDIFNSRDIYIEDYLKNIQKIKISLQENKYMFSEIERPEEIYIDEIFEVKELYENFIKEKVSETDIKSGMILKIKKLISYHQKKYREALIIEKNKIKNRMLKILGGAFLVGLSIGGGVLFIYKDTLFNSLLLNNIIENDLFKSILIELIFIAISLGISLVFANNGSKYKNNISQLPEKIKSDLLTDIDDINYERRSLVNEAKPKIRSFISDTWEDIVDNKLKIAIEKNSVYHKSIFDLSNSFLSSSNDYYLSSEMFLSNVVRFYDDVDKNLEILSKNSKKIKDDAIEPSFDLFKRKQEELEQFYIELTSIEFS